MKSSVLVFLAALSVASVLFAELRISEICPRSDEYDPNGKESGWIELWNDGEEAVDLQDYELVRVNRGKSLSPTGKMLAPRTVPAHGYAVVYMSEAYDNVNSGATVVYDNDVMVCPYKISPKKFPLVALYKGAFLVERFIIPVDLPDNHSFAPAGGAFAPYSSDLDGPSAPIFVDATPLEISESCTVDADSNVVLTNCVYDFSAVKVKQRGLKASSAVTSVLCSTNTWSVRLSFKLPPGHAKAHDGGAPLFFCRQSGASPKSGIVIFIDYAGCMRVEFRNQSGTNKILDVDPLSRWDDDLWHELKVTVAGDCQERFALAVDGVTFMETSLDFFSGLTPTLPICFGHAYDSNYWDIFNGALKDIELCRGTLIERARGVVKPDMNTKAFINDSNSVSRVILPIVTKGFVNNRDGEIAYGPNAGPLYGIKHDFSDWQPFPLAKKGKDYDVTLALNPLSDSTNDVVTKVELIYQADFGTIGSVVMTKGNVVAGRGQLWMAKIPASALPAAGHLIRWAAQVTVASGNRFRTPSFRNPDDGYQWYGTIVEPTVDQISANLPTWHLFVDSISQGKMDKQYDSVKASLPFGARVGIFDSQTSNYYDNVRIDLRGNTTAGMRKKSHGLRFSRVHPLVCMNPFDGELIECRKTSLLAEYADPSKIRSTLSMYLRRLSGQDVPFGYPVRVQLNGSFYQLVHHSNRFTDELIGDYYGYDVNGYAYKNVGSVGGVSTVAMEQVLQDDGTNVVAAYNALKVSIQEVDKYSYSSAGLTAPQWTNVNKAVVRQFDLPSWINFLALARLTQECDDVWANLCLYYDRFGNGTWRPLAYDLHASLGAYFYNDAYDSEHRVPWSDNDVYGKSHPYYGGVHVVTKAYESASRGNRAYEAVYQNEKYRRFHVRRLRTLMDRILKEPGTSQDETPFWKDYVRPMVSAMELDEKLDRAKWGIGTDRTLYVWTNDLSFAEGVADLWDNYFVKRRAHFYNKHSITNTAFAGGYAREKNAQIPLAQSPIAELKDKFSITPVVGGVVIRNFNEETVDMSGWKLSGAMKYTFPAGAVIDQAFGEVPGEVFVVSNRIAYVAENMDHLTDQVILGNATPDDGDGYGLKDATGADVVAGPNRPLSDIFTGDYDSPVVITRSASYAFSNANLRAGLVVADGVIAKLKASADTVNTIASITAASAEVRMTGDGEIKLEGADTLAVVSNLVVKSGTLRIKSTGASASGTPVVKVLGFVEQKGGVIDMDLDVQSPNQLFGIFLANSSRSGAYALFDDGAFNACIGATKSSALAVAQGDVVSTFKGGETVAAVLSGVEPRIVDSSGMIELKRCEVTVSMPQDCGAVAGARVFKTDKVITITDGHYVVSVPGPEAEVFTAGDRITIDGGTFELTSSGDCLHACNRITVNNMLFYALSSAGNVFNSNGDIEINAGTILAYATAEERKAFAVGQSSEAGEYPQQLRINGGTIFASGGLNTIWPQDLISSDSVSMFVAAGLTASDYSDMYLVARGSDDVVTTARLPRFPQSECALLVVCTGLTAAPKLADIAPASGSQDFHELYVSVMGETFQDQLRFLEVYGSTTYGEGDAGEYIVLTNVSDQTVRLGGVKVSCAKVDTKNNNAIEKPKCQISLGSGTVAPHGQIWLDQVDYSTNGWAKIPNGTIFIKLRDVTGAEIQSGYASFDNGRYPGVDGGGAALVAIRFDDKLQDTVDYWCARPATQALDWEHPAVTIESDTKVVDAWPAFAGTAFEQGSAQRLQSWALSVGMTGRVRAPEVLMDAYLLNCANNQLAIDAARRQFRFTSYEPFSIPDPAQFHGYNGVITIEGCRDLDSPWSPATSDDHFFRAILKP